MDPKHWSGANLDLEGQCDPLLSLQLLNIEPVGQGLLVNQTRLNLNKATLLQILHMSNNPNSPYMTDP